MNAAVSCIWPRAILFIKPLSRDLPSFSLDQLAVAGFFEEPEYLEDGIVIDITHLQPRIGSPFEIADRLQRQLTELEQGDFAIGAASDILVARFAAGRALAGSIGIIAPWETPKLLADINVAEVLPQFPMLTGELERVGIRTCTQLAALAEPVVRKLFSDEIAALWRACATPKPVSQPEVERQHNAVHCRVVLPPRTNNLRSVRSHLRRITGVFLQTARHIQRLPGRVLFVARTGDGEDIHFSMTNDIDGSRLPELLRSLATEFRAQWKGGAITHLEIRADNMPAYGGQLDLFSH